jgi:hypothetical protein
MTLAVWLALALPAFAAQPVALAPHVTQVLSSRQTKLGEPFRLDVEVTHPAGQDWTLEVPDGLGPFSLLGRSAKVTTSGGQQVTQLTLTLGLYEPGKHVVPSLTLRETKTGATLPLSEDAEVEAVSTLPANEPHALRDVAPPRALSFRDPKKVAAAVALGLALLALGVFFIRAGLRQWRRFFPPETEEDRDRRLLAGLRDLQEEPFFDALDGLVRRGLTRWHGVPATERTAEEIVQAVKARPPEGVTAAELASVLQDSLLVRFAHGQTSQARRLAALAVCERLFPQQRKGVRNVRPALS